jgi:uncharacterized protein (DUF433 family)
MMASTVQIDTLLVRTPGVCGGRLRIDATRVTLNQIVTCYKRGETPEEIAANFPHVALGQVYAALTYYHTHRDEVEADLAAEQAEAENAEQSHATLSQQP